MEMHNYADAEGYTFFCSAGKYFESYNGQLYNSFCE